MGGAAARSADFIEVRMRRARRGGPRAHAKGPRPAPSLRRGGLAVFVFTPAKAAGPPALTRPLSPARWTDATSPRCAHRRTTARAADGHGRRGVLSHVLLSALLYLRFFPPLSSSLGGVSSPASSLHILLPRGGTVVRVFQDVNVAALQGAVPPSCSRFAWAGGTPRRVKRMRTTVVAG